jgi:hypothetical protein
MALAFWCSIPRVAFSTEDPCRVAYLHADKLTEERACEAAANAGDANAQFGYGLILWSGDQAEHDRRTALDWFRKSARQGNYFAQISLAIFLKHKDVETELRNPIEAYAWMVTSGDEQGARQLRATFKEADATVADRLASDYKAKYAPLQASRAGWWLRVTDGLSLAWPGLIVLGFFVAARRRLKRKFLFVIAGIVIAYVSQHLALWGFALGINPLITPFDSAEQMLNAMIWTFGLSFVLSLLAPSLGVWGLYRFWSYRRWVRVGAL